MYSGQHHDTLEARITRLESMLEAIKERLNGINPPGRPPAWLEDVSNLRETLIHINENLKNLANQLTTIVNRINSIESRLHTLERRFLIGCAGFVMILMAISEPWKIIDIVLKALR